MFKTTWCPHGRLSLNLLYLSKVDTLRGRIYGNLWLKVTCLIKPISSHVLILYPLKTPENLLFSNVCRRYKMGTLARNGLIEFVALRRV